MKLNLTQGGRPVDIAELFDDMQASSGFVLASKEHCKAMDKIAALVKVRERTAHECLVRLEEAGFEHDVAQRAVQRAVECGLVDDHRYAAALIKGKVNQGWGKRKIVMRLQQDGVSDAVVSDCEGLFATSQEEYDHAMRELGKKSARSKNPRVTLVRRLLQRGYSQDLALRAVNDFMAQEGQ